MSKRNNRDIVIPELLASRQKDMEVKIRTATGAVVCSLKSSKL